MAGCLDKFSEKHVIFHDIDFQLQFITLYFDLPDVGFHKRLFTSFGFHDNGLGMWFKRFYVPPDKYAEIFKEYYKLAIRVEAKFSPKVLEILNDWRIIDSTSATK